MDVSVLYMYKPICEGSVVPVCITIVNKNDPNGEKSYYIGIKCKQNCFYDSCLLHSKNSRVGFDPERVP